MYFYLPNKRTGTIIIFEENRPAVRFYLVAVRLLILQFRTNHILSITENFKNVYLSSTIFGLDLKMDYDLLYTSIRSKYINFKKFLRFDYLIAFSAVRLFFVDFSNVRYVYLVRYDYSVGKSMYCGRSMIYQQLNTTACRKNNK